MNRILRPAARIAFLLCLFANGGAFASDAGAAAAWSNATARVLSTNDHWFYIDALHEAEEAARLAPVAFGTNPSNTAASWNIVAGMYFNLGRYEAAEIYFRRAYRFYDSAGPAYVERAARTLRNLAFLYDNLERKNDARDARRRALSLLVAPTPLTTASRRD